MSYQLDLQPVLGYVHLRYQGTIDAAERSRARDQVFEMCRQGELHRALVDMRDCDFQLSPSDAVRFARHFETADLPDNYRLACIIRAGGDGDGMVGQLISLNGVNIRYFHSEPEALNWLTAR